MNTLQRAAFRRKIVYLGVILALFTLSMFWRGVLSIPLSGARAANPSAVQRAADSLAARTVLSRSQTLELREVEQGEQDLESSARQLLILAGRGIYVAALWQDAIDKQKRNDFHKMDQLIRKVTQLQPHFITPWIFQSWNIAYNVSVEMQGSGDMYYYIARGIDLLAEGERRQGRVDPESGQRLGSPDMRYSIAFYYQNKFGVSDNRETLRCLFQLSCIPRNERNAHEGGLLKADGSVDLEKFQRFCEKYPHLVRRLRGEAYTQGGDPAAERRISEALKCPHPDDVLQFLKDNEEVPSRFKTAQGDLNDGDKQFPILPPKFDLGRDEADPSKPSDDAFADTFSAFKAARVWYLYGTVPLPPHPHDANDKPIPAGAPMPASNPMLGEYDPMRYRLPRQPMLILFRQGAPRAQTFQAEMEQKEGWFDDEGWAIDKLADRSQKWFPDSPIPVVVGRGTAWSQNEWRRAATMWRTHGYEYGLDVDPGRMKTYEEAAARRPAGNVDPTAEQLKDPSYRLEMMMANAPFYYRQNRHITNFPRFLSQGEAEQKTETVQARKTLYLAEQARKLGSKPEAIRLYKEGLLQWRDVLINNPEFHRPSEGYSDTVEEETYGFELGYLRLIVQDDPSVRRKAKVLEDQARAVLQATPFAISRASPIDLPVSKEETRWVIAENDPAYSPFVGEMNVPDRRKGSPWIQAYIKDSVRASLGIQRATKPPSMEMTQEGLPPPPVALPGK